MRWICRPGEIRLMAPVAGRGQRCVVVIGMAQSASNRRMRPCQRKRSGVVIECGRSPVGGRVA